MEICPYIDVFKEQIVLKEEFTILYDVVYPFLECLHVMPQLGFMIMF